MILSMTGFGAATVEACGYRVTVEVRSVNSKQMDLMLRLPPNYRALEAEVRSMVTAALERGKAELNMTVEQTADAADMRLNMAVLRQARQQVLQASRELGIPEPHDWWSVLMRFPEVIHTNAASDASDTPDELAAAILRATAEATENLMTHRRSEGERLEEFFAERLRRITALLEQVPQYETQRVGRIRARIEEGLRSLPPHIEYDKGRLEQEMIFYIEKLDINEEKQRLAQHLRYFAETIQARPGQGKKLGFIAQEMGREINTLGSKSNQADMQILVVKMKDELEQIKEQVLNAM